MSVKKYSDWLRIDLHIHTIKSKETKNGDYKGFFDVSTLKSKLVENEVQIFSLTDHNIINIVAYEEYYKSYTDTDPLLLVGVELDIEGDKNTYHSLLIFNAFTIDEVKEISSRLESKYSELGLDNFLRKLDFEQINDLFHDKEFFFIPHADSHKSIVNAYKDVTYTQQMVLLMPSAVEKVSKEETKRIYNKGFDSNLQESFRNKDDIPYINFSDNHNINQYPCTHMGENGNHEFYYVKGNKSYETIRLAFIDPKSRIKSQVEYNNLNKTINTIDKLKIDEHDLFISNELIFSPHLNVIIGGRSSGKSLLMYLIGKNIDSIDTTEKDKDYKGFHGEHISIKSKLDDGYKEKTVIDKPIYINQSDIVDYFEKNNLKELAEKSNKKFEYNEAKSKFGEHQDELKLIIQKMINRYEDIQEYDVKKFELHKKDIDSIHSSSYTINLNIESFKTINETIISELNEIRELIDSLFQNLTLFSDNKHIEISETEKETIEAFQRLIDEKLALIKIKQKNQNRIEVFLSKVQENIQESNSTSSEESQQKTLSKSSIKSLRENIKVHFFNYARLKESTKKIESFDYSKQEVIVIDENVTLVLEVEKNDDIQLKDTILDSIKSPISASSIYINLFQLLNSELQVKTYGGNRSENFSKKIDSILSELFNLIENPKDYLAYSDGKTSKDSSPGLNSENYLAVLLKNSENKIIFIDQPEDNLGNKFISEELVKTIREIKFKNQLFLVTHNPSIVVYGDAENIIIAENLDNKISYRQIVLEDVTFQKEICSILDGGEYIFDNRAKKYNIQRILKSNNS
jgi:hypothetical protein